MGLIPDPGSFTCFGCQKGGKGRKEGKGEGGKEERESLFLKTQPIKEIIEKF